MKERGPSAVDRGIASSCGDVYAFGEFELDAAAFELRTNGRAVRMTDKALSVLVYLVMHRERPVSRTELMTALWPDVRVSAGSLSQAIWEVRRTLQDHRNGSRFIRTLRRRGYWFCADVVVRRSLDMNVLTRLIESPQGQGLPDVLKDRLRGMTDTDLAIVLHLASLLAQDHHPNFLDTSSASFDERASHSPRGRRI